MARRTAMKAKPSTPAKGKTAKPAKATSKQSPRGKPPSRSPF